MASYQIAYNTTTKVATVQSLGDILPGGSTNIGKFDHDDDEDDVLGIDESHVLYHHVRDALYHIVPSEQNMQSVTINVDTTYTPLVSMVIAPATVELAVAETEQLTITPTPGGANPAIESWVSSYPARATVSATGLVTAVGAGVAVITATAVDGGIVATRDVTVA